MRSSIGARLRSILRSCSNSYCGGRARLPPSLKFRRTSRRVLNFVAKLRLDKIGRCVILDIHLPEYADAFFYWGVCHKKAGEKAAALFALKRIV